MLHFLAGLYLAGAVAGLVSSLFFYFRMAVEAAAEQITEREREVMPVILITMIFLTLVWPAALAVGVFYAIKEKSHDEN